MLFPACQCEQEALLQNILLMIFTFMSSLLNLRLYCVCYSSARLTDALIRPNQEENAGVFTLWEVFQKVLMLFVCE